MCAVAGGGAFYSPIWPLLGYVSVYCIGAERQWWHAPLNGLGLRYSLAFSALIGISMAMNWGRLRFGDSRLCRHERLFLIFLGIVWLCALIGPETLAQYTYLGTDPFPIKMTKVVVFLLMLTHVVTDSTNLDRLIWVLVILGLVLGVQAWETPYSAFGYGRLETIGGPDFAESNFFASFMACLLWIIGIQFLRSGTIGKIVCFTAGGFAANAIILTRSRGAIVGLAAGGLMAVLFAPRRYRTYLAVGMILAAVAFLRLADEGFLQRVATTVSSEEERDASAQSRLDLTMAAPRLWLEHPLGVGPGNYRQTIGNYLPHFAGKDPHNTYAQCLIELGTQGFILLALMIAGAFSILRQTNRAALELPVDRQDDVHLLSYGMMCALTTLMACGLTLSFMYVEFFWWLLALPVCLQRVVSNGVQDALEHSDGLAEQ